MQRAAYVCRSNDDCRFRAGAESASANTSAFRVIGLLSRIPYCRPLLDPSPAPQRASSGDRHCGDLHQLRPPRHKRPHVFGQPGTWLLTWCVDSARFIHGAKPPRVNLAVGCEIPERIT